MAVPNSFALAASQFGHDLRIAHPKGYELDQDLLGQIEENAREYGASVEFTDDVAESFDNVDVVYAKSWGSSSFYGDDNAEIAHRSRFRDQWIVDEAKMARTNSAAFMHCLPVRRNVIVTDGVIDSANSVVIDEAENRLHVQKAIMAHLIK
jgi:N-acetylornithine carbamoyltransferase